MKRLYYVTCIIVLSCVVASGFIIPITDETSGNSARTGAPSAQNVEYIIKSEGDRIVVYKENMDKPYLETTTAVSSLPTDIQAKLNLGISYTNEESMKEALNEFCS